MSNILNTQTLRDLDAQFAILGVAGYALPVRFLEGWYAVKCIHYKQTIHMISIHL